jgi:predicted O-methyltransferase YrrM
MSELNDRAWPDQLEMALAELKDIPGAGELFQRKAAAEGFFLDINARHEARYQPGWMNLDDGLFLYWLVRRMRPRAVVETGVANGFSTGLILLAMAKNGNQGKLHAIGRAEVFDADDPRWTQKGESFGEVVVTGKNLGWMVSDSLRDSVEFHAGDAKLVLPQVAAKLDAIDLFFHDSDHSYDHMMFEFEEAKRKLSPNGAVVADNIAWNSSLWDFADEYGAPAYNFRGSVGAAFFG